MPNDFLINEEDGRMLLNSVPGWSGYFQYLLDSFNQNPSEILSANEAELLKVNGVGQMVSQAIRQAVSSRWLEKKKKNLLKWAVFFSSEIKSLSTLSSWRSATRSLLLGSNTLPSVYLYCRYADSFELWKENGSKDRW